MRQSGEPRVSPAAHAREDLHAVGFDLLPRAPAVAALAEGEPAVYLFRVYFQIGGKPLYDGGERTAVRFPARHPFEHGHISSIDLPDRTDVITPVRADGDHDAAQLVGAQDARIGRGGEHVAYRRQRRMPV